jgi:hypothetical protein
MSRRIDQDAGLDFQLPRDWHRLGRSEACTLMPQLGFFVAPASERDDRFAQG